jgi:hypothetical protein
MKHFVILFLLIASQAAFAHAQKSKNSGLVFTGTVLRVSNPSGDASKQFEVRLQLQFRNDGDTPLIVFLPGRPWLGQTKIDFLKKLATGSDDEVGTVKVFPWVNPDNSRPSYNPFPWFVRRLDAPEPSSNLRIIEPGGYYEFGDVITVDCCYEFDIGPGQTNIDLRTKTPTSEFPALKVEYHLSLKKHHKDDDFLRTLQRRWKPFGHLLLDGNGDFTVRSEAIVNKSGE